MLLFALATITLTATPDRNLVGNPDFETPDSTGKKPLGFVLSGAAHWAANGYTDEFGTSGVTLDAYGKDAAGSVSQSVHVDRANGKWVTFRFRGKAEDGFLVGNDALFMQMDFYGANGAHYEDKVHRLIYREILRDRADFTANGDFRQNGAAVWRTYELEELLPFADTDTVKLTVGFANGVGKDKTYSRFLVDDFELTQGANSRTGRQDPADVRKPMPSTMDTSGMLSLGGKWFYRPAFGETIKSSGGHVSQQLVIDHRNADRLFYKDDRMVNPFAGNMSAWLRKGYMDRNGTVATKDRLIPDNVVLTFSGNGWLTILTHNIPNHPTAKFPDTYGTQGYNPGYIQEQNLTFSIPLEPKKSPGAVAMTQNDSNYALPMGPVGLAVNGVVFFNPFDANMTDAANQMDRCCGHPNPGANQYHYHKYPICVNTPFADKGDGHSPIVGFALDGFPVYGPYESKGTMAKDQKANPLDAFNAHYDSIRGWHYHVTPGKYPYILGGYLGTVAYRQRGPGF